MYAKPNLLPHVVSERFSEIDLVRGLALIGMAVYHEVHIAKFIVTGQFWQAAGVPRLFGWLVALTFLFVFGMSAQIKYQRLRQKKLPFPQIYQQFFWRAVVIAMSAGVVSLSTWLSLPDHWIRMGVLHFFAIATLLLPFFLENKKRLLVAVIAVLLIWAVLQPFDTSSLTTYWLLPFDLLPAGYTSLDHWPQIPFLAVPLAGALLSTWYVPRRTQWIPHNFSTVRLTAPFVWIGRHSLLVYLLHVPGLLLFTFLIYQLVLAIFPA